MSRPDNEHVDSLLQGMYKSQIAYLTQREH